MEEKKEEKKNDHEFLLRVPEDMWQRLVATLPVSISANEKINTLIRDFVLEYEYVLKGNRHDSKKR